MLFRRVFRRVVSMIGRELQTLSDQIADDTLPAFGNSPRNLHIALPRTIANGRYMYFGDDVWIGPGALLLAVTAYPGISTQHPGAPRPVQRFTPRITIGSRVTATAGLQIAAHERVTIGDDVILATNVNLTDGMHGYENADEAYKYQPIFRIAPIAIERGCWIGQNVVVLPGVTVGEFSIVAANSVVAESIPPRSIAAGQPARVVKRWEAEARRWLLAGTSA